MVAIHYKSLSLVHKLLFVRIEKEARSCLLLEYSLISEG